MRLALIADDDPAVRRATARRMGAAGWTTIDVGSVTAARTMLTVRPDVVITDMAMHRARDGEEILRAVKAAWPDVPVVLYTGFYAPSEDAAAWDGVVLKPDIGELVRFCSRFRVDR